MPEYARREELAKAKGYESGVLGGLPLLPLVEPF